jgi:hypothetical protein
MDKDTKRTLRYILLALMIIGGSAIISVTISLIQEYFHP